MRETWRTVPPPCEEKCRRFATLSAENVTLVISSQVAGPYRPNTPDGPHTMEFASVIEFVT